MQRVAHHHDGIQRYVEPLSIEPLSIKPLSIKPLSIKPLSIKPLCVNRRTLQLCLFFVCLTGVAGARSVSASLHCLGLPSASICRGTGIATKGTGIATKGTGIATKSTGIATKGTGIATKGTCIASASSIMRLSASCCMRRQLYTTSLCTSSAKAAVGTGGSMAPATSPAPGCYSDALSAKLGLLFRNHAAAAFANGETLSADDAVTNTILSHLKGRSPGLGFGRPEYTRESFPYTSRLRPGTLSKERNVPSRIDKPRYATPDAKRRLASDRLRRYSPQDPIPIRTEEEIRSMRFAGYMARQVLDITGKEVRPGVTTDYLDEVAHKACMLRNVYPSPLRYRGFPKSICTSVNEVMAHGIPNKDTVLEDGDIVTIDITVYIRGHHGDCAETFIVGCSHNEATLRLVKFSYDALLSGITACRPGAKFCDIGLTIQRFCERHGKGLYRSPSSLCGHGIHSVFHDRPSIFATRNKYPGRMQCGHTFTIEPVVVTGHTEFHMWPDGWTIAATDGGKSSQFEHTILVTDDAAELLTAKQPHSPLFFWDL